MRTIDCDDDEALPAAAAALRAGEIVVLPTDTVYGVAAWPDIAGAADAIFAAKGRPPGQHLPVLAATLDQVRALGVDLSPQADALASRWWPGPLTMVFAFDPSSPRPIWLEGRDEVAVRIPDHEFLRRLIGDTGVLLVTSANRHGAGTPASAREAGRELAPHVHLAIDGGALTDSPSSLVNVSSPTAVTEREGSISEAAIAAVLAEVGGPS